MHKILTIAFKDMLRSFRSLFAVGMMLVAPMLITGLIYLAFGNLASGQEDEMEMQTLKVGVLNLDQPQSASPDLGQLVVDFLKNPALPSWIETSEISGLGLSETEIDLKTYGVVVVIPTNFSNAVLQSGSRASLDIYYDSALTIQPQVIKALLTNFCDGLSGTSIAIDVIGRQLDERGMTIDAVARQKIITDFVTWSTQLQQQIQSSDPAVSHLRINAPQETEAAPQPTAPMANVFGLVLAGQVIFFAFYTGAYSCTSILKEQDEGTLARLFTTPTPRTAILAGKFTAVLLTVIVQVLVLMGIGGLAFQINWGQPLAVALAVLGLVVSASGLGIFLIALVKTERQSGVVLGGVLTFAGMVGGLFTVAVPSMPAAFEIVNLFVPHGWALRAFRLTVGGGSPGELWVPVLAMLAFGGVLYGLGAVIFRKRFA